jgi:hypothetical protein
VGRLLSLALTGVVAAALTGGCAVGKGVGSDLEAAREFDAYPLYWPGDRFEKWPLTHVDVVNTPYALFVYGNCETSGNAGCAPPLQLQIAGLCDHLDEAARNPIWKERRIRGAPVGMFDGAPVLFTDRVQIKVYRGQGSDRDTALRALRVLRSLNLVEPLLSPDERIPAPAPGVLEGTAACP